MSVVASVSEAIQPSSSSAVVPWIASLTLAMTVLGLATPVRCQLLRQAAIESGIDPLSEFGMPFDVAFVTKVFAALFAIMNPIANVPVFLSLTEGASDEERRKVAVTAAVGTALGCLIALAAGQALLDAFGLSVADFRLAGGLIVLLIALSMLHGSPSQAHAGSPQEHAETNRESVAIYPLTIPLLVGPGTIATLIVFAQTARTQHKWIELGVGVGGFLALLTAALLTAPLIGRHLSATANAITKRLMGMILAAVAMEMIVVSLRELFPGLVQ